ncbi:hypothetical protein N9H93_02795 [Rhizobiaceae bacterium]|nr:hypothetical protein [Rhizobiaceae bacterium]
MTDYVVSSDHDPWIVEGNYQVAVFGRTDADPADLARLVQRLDSLKDAAHLLNRKAGNFSCYILNREARELFCYTSIARQFPLYYFEGDRRVVVGSSGVLTALLAYGADPVEYDTIGLAQYQATGAIVGSQTVFKGVKMLAPNQSLHIKGGNVKRMANDESLKALCSDDGNELDGQAIASLFNSGLEASATTKQVVIGLTSGKDSRVILSGALATGMDVKCYTVATQTSEENVADVATSAAIASDFGLDHKITYGNGRTDSGSYAFDPANVFLTNILVRDCETPVMPRVRAHCEPTLIPPTTSTRLQLSGIGGEACRGGYGSKDLNWYRNKDADDIDVMDLVRTKACASTTHLVEDISSLVREAADETVEELHAIAGANGMLELYYHYFNLGRWGAGSFRVGNSMQPLFMPFADNRTLRAVYALNRADRRTEAVHRAIIRENNSNLFNYPLGSADWPETPARQARGKVQKADSRHAIFWFMFGQPRTYLYDLIHSAGLAEQFFSKTFRVRYLDDLTLHTPSMSGFVWRLAQAAFLASGQWIRHAGEVASPRSKIVVHYGDAHYEHLALTKAPLNKLLRVLSRAQEVGTIEPRLLETLATVRSQFMEALPNDTTAHTRTGAETIFDEMAAIATDYSSLPADLKVDSLTTISNVARNFYKRIHAEKDDCTDKLQAANVDEFIAPRR